MPKDVEHHTLVLDESTAYDKEHYGIIYRGRHVYRTTKSSAPTRLVVWDNTHRPNDGSRIPIVVRRIAGEVHEGKYLDPHNEPTDERYSLLLSPESSAICADTRFNTGQPGSGQVYGNGTLGDNDTATIVYPNGGMGEIEVTLHFPKWNNGHGHATVTDVKIS